MDMGSMLRCVNTNPNRSVYKFSTTVRAREPGLAARPERQGRVLETVHLFHGRAVARLDAETLDHRAQIVLQRRRLDVRREVALGLGALEARQQGGVRRGAAGQHLLS